MEISTLKALLNIAEKAIDADACQRDAKHKRICLNEAYDGYKESIGADRVERGTKQWDNMLAWTASEYQELKVAERAAKNAKRRLDTAVARYNRGAE